MNQRNFSFRIKELTEKQWNTPVVINQGIKFMTYIPDIVQNNFVLLKGDNNTNAFKRLVDAPLAVDSTV